ncbi:peptidase inhibitor family I36 protein [Wenjunlia tyrosinilytica]|uniref:peptidase inhibitor family I36 protein n=1 Tax=Wenjunlia tyrosinilytica TaxID=1544741 RepID=UPI0016657809|nr:peptidase inhibitor family I36 protein [Wenjunlia tyrosinilytica]
MTAAQRADLQSQVDETLSTTAGGVQISANEIAWNGGEPILTLPLPGQEQAPAASPAARDLMGFSADDATPDVNWHKCPAGGDDNRWYCFYENSNFGGRRLQWNWAHCQDPIAFDDYGFARKASSWVNTTRNIDHWGMKVEVYSTSVRLWVENPWSQVAYVGDSKNDRAMHAFACRL